MKNFFVRCDCGFHKVLHDKKTAKSEIRSHKSEFPGHHPEVR